MSLFSSFFKHQACKPVIILTAVMLLTTSCSTVSINYQATHQTIAQKRSNIVTQNALSDNTVSTLLSNGIDANTCLTELNMCIQQLNNSLVDNKNKSALALFSELHLAKAKLLMKHDVCNQTPSRPPIDSYYTNAPITAGTQEKQHQRLKKCHFDYPEHLLQAIKTSYAYLFYNQLTTSLNTPSSLKSNYLPTDLDIQTQDVYEFASDALIKLLYANANNSPDTAANDNNYLKTELLLKPQQTTTAKTADGQIKALRYTLLKHGESGTVQPLYIDLSVPDKPIYLDIIKKHKQHLREIYASHDLNFSGLNTINQREGVGISYITLLKNHKATSLTNMIKSGGRNLNLKNPTDRIHRTGNLLLSGLALPEGNTLDSVLTTSQFDVKLYNPHTTDSVDILGEPYSLTANFSASYGIWMSESDLGKIGYFSLLARQQALTLPQLFTLEPYDPNKRIIIMLHGLASSPNTWVKVTNDIFNDGQLRDNYQVWQIFYPTNIPILENRYQIQKLIETAYQTNDPNGTHPASQHSVLIGHSMGAVIGRMLLANQNLETKFSNLDKTAQNKRLNKLIQNHLDKQNINNRLNLRALNSVDRAVFMSAPFRGTKFADRWFTLTLRRIIQLPLGFAQTITGNLKSIATEGELTESPFGALYLQNGASQLSNKSSFMQLTGDLAIADNITYHSIIASQDSDITQGLAQLHSSSHAQLDLSKTHTDNTITKQDRMMVGENSSTPVIASINVAHTISNSIAEKISDGIVPYTSSHLEGAASETIISSKHNVHETPQALITLRKILHEHLKAHPIED